MHVAGVYLIFKHENGEFIDRVVRWVTGGKHTHVEFAFVMTEGRQSRIFTVGSLWPLGVYASDLLHDPFYNLYEKNGKRKAVDVNRGLGWTWVDITQMFTSVVQRDEALVWAMNRVGKSKYRTSVFGTWLLPYSHSTLILQNEDHHRAAIPKKTYICSEFCADIMIAFGKTNEEWNACVKESCERLGGLWQGDTQKLSPAGLFRATVDSKLGKQLDPLTVRLMVQNANSKLNT